LGDPVVQAQLARADLVVPSLDGATDTAFQAICRPAAGVTVRSVIDGIASFRRSFSGRLLLEMFIVPGLNDDAEELAALKRAAASIMPDAIQLNSLDRPAPEPGVNALSPEELRAIRDSFKPLQVQLVRQRGKDEPAPWGNSAVHQEILSVLEGSSSTLEELSLATGIREGDLAKTLARMSDQAMVHYDQVNDVIGRRR
jgi:wyosine [tRNA(Phe)-imidazoG37] synthetase (radical SAM superfamily)